MKLDTVIHSFNSNFTKLVTKISSQNPTNEHIHRLRRLVKIKKEEDPLFLINSMEDKIWENRQLIIDHDPLYFQKPLLSDKDIGEQYRTMVYALKKLSQNEFDNLSKLDRIFLWKLNESMLENVINYKALKKLNS